MYMLTKPLMDYTNAQVESFSRLAQSRDLAELSRSGAENFWRLIQENQTRFLQSDALAQLTKASVDNYSRFIQDSLRSFSTLAFEAQGQMTKGIQEGTKRLQEVANTTSNFVGTAAHETAETAKNAAEQVSEEARTARRRA